METLWIVAIALGTAVSPQDEEMERLRRAAAQEKQKELESLPERVGKLEKQVAQQQPAWDPARMLSFATPDGNFTAKIGGRIYIVARHVFDRDDGGGGGADNFLVDDARIQLDGTFFRDFFYRLETTAKTGSPSVSITSTGTVDPDGAGPLAPVPVSVTGSSTATAAMLNLNDVYVGYGGLKEFFTVQFGQFKEPFSQEETTSSRFIDFAERSVYNAGLVVPSRDVGVMLSGAVADGLLQWNLGAFNGTGVGKPKNLADNNDEKDLAGRIFVSPLKNGPALVKNLRLGVDATVGDVDGPVALGAMTSGDYSGVTLIPATLPQLDGLRRRLALNFSWASGPFSLRAEYGTLHQELQESYAPAGDFEIRAWYVQGTWLLTGEDKAVENRIKPRANLNPLEGTWGAFELALRFAAVDAGDLQDAGLISAAANSEVREATLGLNWWWTPNVVLRLNWERLMFDEDLPVGSGDALEDSQDIFYLRWQIDF
ncbi:MAG TPA: porin [Planctomycetota bacterium]|nr:porin [Planctomycetota bacterium]